MKILWIDDEIELLKPYIYFLKDKGYEVLTATNGPDGIELVKREGVDLVLLDEWMSGMEGLEVLRRLKKIDPNLLVAMVTKSEEEGLMDEAYGHLVDDYIVKPLTIPQVSALVKRLLEKRRLITQRIASEYAQEFGFPSKIENPEDWIKYYISLIQWQLMLSKFGDEGIREVHSYQAKEFTTAFSKYIEDVYPEWIKGGRVTLSHNFLKRFLIKELESPPVYLFLFDAMRLDQWLGLLPIIREDFEVETEYYFSILPSATPYSRNAIFSGLLPLQIKEQFPQYWVGGYRHQNKYEKELLGEFLKRERPHTRFIFLKVSRTGELEGIRGELLKKGIDLYVVVINFLDLLIHSVKSDELLSELVRDEATLISLTRVWFVSSKLSQLFQMLKGKIVITSDHGFLKVQRPTIIYGGKEISPNLRYKYGGGLRCDPKTAIILSDPKEYMLPSEVLSTKYVIAKEDYYFIYPTKPHQYEQTYKYTYQHGGVSPAEMIIPVGFLKCKK